MAECEFISRSEEETKELGRALGKLLPKGAVVILKGDLGCGKTVLTKGIASALGIPEDEISSPSFNIVHEYEDLVHSDLYRVGSSLEDLGVEELLEDERIKVFEWGEPLVDYSQGAFIVECREEGESRIFRISDPTGKICEKLREILEERCQE